MLGASSVSTGRTVELAAIGDRSVDPILPGAAELLAFTDAVIARNDDDIAVTRAALADRLGPAAAGKAASCIGNFEMMNRILDATGVPTPASVAAIRTELGIGDHGSV